MFAIEILLYNLMMKSGRKFGRGKLKVDSQGRVGAKYANFDVLLRKRA